MHSTKDPLHDRIRQLRGDGGHRKTRTGKVVGVSEHYDRKDIARIELEDEAKPPKLKTHTKGEIAPSPSYRRRFDVEVPKAQARDLALGDRVHVSTIIEKA
jgi:hypothetical protein